AMKDCLLLMASAQGMPAPAERPAAKRRDSLRMLPSSQDASRHSGTCLRALGACAWSEAAREGDTQISGPLRPSRPRRWCYDCGHMAEESGALKILANVSDMLNKLAAPAAEQIGQLLAYKLHPYTVRNFVATIKKTERI